MEDTMRRSSPSSDEPFSDDEFEAAMNRINPNNQQDDEEESEDTGIGYVENEQEDVPDDDSDEEDITDEVDTPVIRRKTSPKKVTLTESKERTKVQPSETESEDDNEPHLSRKQRGKLIQELTQQLQQKEQERQELLQIQQRSNDEEQRLNREIEKALGSDDAYEQALEAGLRGDETEQERARVWKANRKFYSKLVLQAERDFQKRFAGEFWGVMNKLDGVDKKVVQTGNIPQVLQHVYLAGTRTTSADKDAQIEELEETVANLQGMLSSKKPQVGSTRRSPVGAGGNAVAPEKGLNWRSVGLDPETGLPSDAMEALVEQYGQRAFTDQNILKQLLPRKRR